MKRNPMGFTGKEKEVKIDEIKGNKSASRI